MDSLYIKNRLALIDFTKAYYDSYEELLSSSDFRAFLNAFLDDLKDSDQVLYTWVMKKGEDREDIIDHLIIILKYLTVISYDETAALDQKDVPILLSLVEKAYNYWRNLHRFSYIYSKNGSGILGSRFISSDMHYNELILGFYRLCQEKLQGHRNFVYRQLQAGTNASLFMVRANTALPAKYDALKKIPFISKVMMRSPMMIYLDHNKRLGTFTETKNDPMAKRHNYHDFFCYPILVGTCLTFVYFHKDFMASAIGLANLFEFAPPSLWDKKPQCIILFGIKDNRKDTDYYYDEENDIYVGKISYQPVIEYFGYFKKMALTLHNLVMIKKGYLPIHGAMLKIRLKDGRTKGVCLMGDSGAGKSETIEAMNKIADLIDAQTVIFDDMGIMYEKDGTIYAQGTEIGAFVRLDDLDNSATYRDMDRSIFFNPGNNNARVITPASPYNVVISPHKVDIFLYANNYDDKRGISLISDVKEAKEIYVRGRRYALGTTNEVGLSETYFANPFGPMQEKEMCDPLIDHVLEKAKESGVLLGEIYTNLGLKNKGHGGIEIAAKELIKLISK